MQTIDPTPLPLPFSDFFMCLFLDNDECEGSTDCEQECINRNGGYECACKPGYELNADGKTCKGQWKGFNV